MVKIPMFHGDNNSTLRLCFFRFGCCEVAISDQGREFVNKVKTELFRLTGPEQRVTSAYHPQSNGLTERFNQTLQSSLLKVVKGRALALHTVCLSHQLQKSTNLTPFEVMYVR